MNSPRFDQSSPDNLLTAEQQEILFRIGWAGHSSLREALETSLLECSKVSGLMNHVREMIEERLQFAISYLNDGSLADMPLSPEGVSRLIEAGVLSDEMLESLDEAREDVLKQAFAHTMGNYFLQCLELHFHTLAATGTSEEHIASMKEKGMKKILKAFASFSLKELQQTKTMEDHIRLLNELLGNFYDCEEELKGKFDETEMQAVPELLHALIEELTRRKDEDEVHTIAITQDGELVEVCGKDDEGQATACAVATNGEESGGPGESWLKPAAEDPIFKKPFSRFSGVGEIPHEGPLPRHLFHELAKKTLPSMEDLYNGFAQSTPRVRPAAPVRGAAKPTPLNSHGLAGFMPPDELKKLKRNKAA